MPIDAEKFLARIKGEPDRPASASLREARQAALADEAPTAANAPTPSSDGTSDDRSVLGAKLEATTNKSLDKAHQILDIPLDPDRAHYPAELRAQTALINSTLNTQARVDETGLQRQQVDRLPELLKLIREEEAKLPPRYRDGGPDD